MKTNARIYVMQGADGTIKLGHSKNPEQRLKEIGNAVAIAHQSDVLERAEEIERLAHRVLALHGRHIRGEWFEAKLDDAINAIAIAIRQAECTELRLGGVLNHHMRRPRPKTEILAVSVTAEMLASIDRKRKQGVIPLSRTDYIRKLVIEADRKAKRGRQ